MNVPSRHRVARLWIAVLAAGLVLAAAGCLPDNGAPGDLRRLLAESRIPLVLTGSKAPISGRSAMVWFAENPTAQAALVEVFALNPLSPSDPGFSRVAGQLPAPPQRVWGVTGRPASLKLSDGGQFEYLYLVTTADGTSYLLVEYAYG